MLIPVVGRTSDNPSIFFQSPKIFAGPSTHYVRSDIDPTASAREFYMILHYIFAETVYRTIIREFCKQSTKICEFENLEKNARFFIEIPVEKKPEIA